MNDNSIASSILLIDDDRELGQMLRDYLATESLNIHVCVSGEAGLQELRMRDFDLLILDIMLPGINGLDVLKTLRATNDIPVIMLTAKGQERDVVTAFEAGATDYVTKPFSFAELIARISRALAPHS